MGGARRAFTYFEAAVIVAREWRGGGVMCHCYCYHDVIIAGDSVWKGAGGG